MLQPWTWQECRLLHALMYLESDERPVTVEMLAKQAVLEVTDAEHAVTSLVAKGFLDMAAVRHREIT